MEKAIQIHSVRGRAIAAALAAWMAVMIAFGVVQTVRLDRANARLDAISRKAFYETCELTESMSVNLRKLLVAGEPGQIQLLLGQIAKQAQGASGNLALLPMGENMIAGTLKFINQTGDFAEGLAVRVASGGAIGESDYQTIHELSENAAKFSVGMTQLLARVESGEIALNAENAAESADFAPISNPAAEYPTLLYDGPFSDGATGDRYRALEGMNAVTRDEAEKALRAYFGNVSEIHFVQESSVPIEVYEFALTAGGYSMSAAVTKQGGQVLYALSDADVSETNMTAEQLLDTARAFLLARGYGAMEMRYYSRYEGILTINYAAVQDGILLYPDLVKVQLSMADGAVIGVEAGNYLLNHAPRVLPAPSLTEEEAIARIGSQLTAIAVRLSVIPTAVSEALCYEIRATDGADTFLVYIDAATGAERELMQVVSDESGILVM